MKFKKFNTMVLAMALAGSLCLTPVAAAEFTDGSVGFEEPEFITEEDMTAAELSDEIYIDGGICGDNATWALSESGILTISGTGRAVLYGNSTTNQASKLIVQKGITYFDCSTGSIENISSVELPNTLQGLGTFTFGYCKNLTSVTIPDSVTDVGPYVFQGCSSLTNIQLSKNLTYISNNMFEDCSSLTEITLPESITLIDYEAFRKCASLKSIKIPSKVTVIGSACFEYCDSLQSITMGNHITEIGVSAFENCISLSSVIIPDSVTEICAYAFENCTKLEKVVIGNSVSEINREAFQDCISLKEIYFCGNAPKFAASSAYEGVFHNVSATAYYPAGDKTWQPYNMTNHGAGTIYWKTWLPSPIIAGVSNTASGPKVSWPKASGATAYYVYRSVNGGDFQQVKTTSSTSWTDTTAKTNGARYDYKICAVNGSNKSEYSSVKTTYYLTAPAAPKLTNTAARKLNVSWKKNAKATGYQLQYASNSKFTSAKTVTISSNSSIKKTISKLTKNKKYYVRVRSMKNVLGAKYYSPWSSAKSLTIKK